MIGAVILLIGLALIVTIIAIAKRVDDRQHILIEETPVIVDGAWPPRLDFKPRPASLRDIEPMGM